jgi:hypothetical protein
MIPEPQTKKAAKSWMLEHVWRERCASGHLLIPTEEELEWNHHDDGKSMSVRRTPVLRTVYCDYCWMNMEHVALRETIRLTKEYCDVLVWGGHGS